MKKQGKFLGAPYNWRKPTSKTLTSAIWNKHDHRLFPPKAIGWGYTVNFYELLHYRKKLLALIVIIVILLGAFVIRQKIELNKVHSTFENYYAFRGCTKLIKRTDTYGICKTNNGDTIKIVEFNKKWYLDGDLPVCLFHLCN